MKPKLLFQIASATVYASYVVAQGFEGLTDEQWNAAVEVSKAKALEAYPAVRDHQGALVAEMRRINSRLKSSNDPIYFSPNKPFLVTRMAAEKLGIAPKTLKPASTTIEPLPFATDSAERGLVLRIYPDLGIAGSAFNIAFVRLFKEMVAAGDPRVSGPDRYSVVARIVAQNLRDKGVSFSEAGKSESERQWEVRRKSLEIVAEEQAQAIETRARLLETQAAQRLATVSAMEETFDRMMRQDPERPSDSERVRRSVDLDLQWQADTLSDAIERNARAIESMKHAEMIRSLPQPRVRTR